MTNYKISEISGTEICLEQREAQNGGGTSPPRQQPPEPPMYGETQRKDGSSPPHRPYHSGGSSSISKGRWHALVAGSTSVITAASKPLVSVLLSWVLPQ